MDLYDMGADCTTTSGGRYIFVFVIARSRYTLVEVTDKKSNAFACFKRVCARVGYMPKILRHDNAGEHISSEFLRFLQDHQVQPQFSAPYEQHQNGISESGVNKISKKCRVILQQSGLPIEFWGWALLHAVDIVNHLPHSKTGKIPLLDHGSSDFAKYLRPFGCHATCYLGKDRIAHGKISPRGVDGIYLGCAIRDGIKGYIIWIPTGKSTGKFITTTNCTFDETFFPYRVTRQRYHPHYSDALVRVDIPISPVPDFSQARGESSPVAIDQRSPTVQWDAKSTSTMPTGVTSPGPVASNTSSAGAMTDCTRITRSAGAPSTPVLPADTAPMTKPPTRVTRSAGALPLKSTPRRCSRSDKSND